MASKHTQGGIVAHILRRLIHVSMIFIPWLYYHFIFPAFSPQTGDRLLLGLIVIVAVFECIRVKYRIVLFAQRYHEASQLSAFGWTMISLAVILMVSPSMAFSMPIVASCALADPLMGEMRLQKIKSSAIIFSAAALVAVIWIVCAYYFQFHYWLAIVMALVTVAVEWPSIKWVDDNALMLLVPLILILLFQRLHVGLF